ncbi:hypothetical protein [uncultured Fusobacterium sp.]|uniref:hypothetical protein n=1 Tax=uncultured Fusobacterium sp. TaxID=159267 RepID=UPI0015A6C581|nr:hypothetical protein [uncultured Fusobacterium sp.]DAQ00445.1 MAG TPA: tail protein [Caudoviricetes sp.]
MSRIALKKYVEEQLQFDLETYLDDIVHDFAFNAQDYLMISSSTTAKQLISIKKELLELKAKTIITVLGVAISKNFVERILNNLPIYEKKDPLIIEIANSVSRELQKIELLKEEYLSGLSIQTSNTINLRRLEEIYGVATIYGLDIKTRKNILIAREITRYSIFNFAYILKICELFEVGKVIDIVNDKSMKTITIFLEENILNISNIEIFKKHMNEFCPAWYEVLIKNNT